MPQNFTITIEPHPAVARHPFTKEPLRQDGKPVPLFPDERCIKLDGKKIAYVGNAESGRAVMFIRSKDVLGKAICDMVTQEVVREFGELGDVNSVPGEEDKE